METNARARESTTDGRRARLEETIERVSGAATAVAFISEAAGIGAVSLLATADLAAGRVAWIDAAGNSAWLPAVLLGAVATPLVVGFCARSWYGIVLTFATAFFAAMFCSLLGLMLVRLAYPSEPAGAINPATAFGLWAFLAGPMIAAAAGCNAAIGAALGQFRGDSWEIAPRRHWSSLIVAAILILIEATSLFSILR